MLSKRLLSKMIRYQAVVNYSFKPYGVQMHAAWPFFFFFFYSHVRRRVCSEIGKEESSTFSLFLIWDNDKKKKPVFNINLFWKHADPRTALRTDPNSEMITPILEHGEWWFCQPLWKHNSFLSLRAIEVSLSYRPNLCTQPLRSLTERKLNWL